MKLQLIYKIIAGVYDLLDVIYFRNYDNSPRKSVLEAIGERDSVLDLCTGTATTAIKIAINKPETKIIGIDISEEMLREGNNKVKKNNIKNLKLLEMDATDTNFKDKQFDKVLMSLILHELDEPLAEKILSEAKRVLREDGEIIITEWEPSHKLWRKLLFMPIHLLEPKSYKRFIKKDLYKYFRNLGLEIEEIIHCDYTKVIRCKKAFE